MFPETVSFTRKNQQSDAPKLPRNPFALTKACGATQISTNAHVIQFRMFHKYMFPSVRSHPPPISGEGCRGGVQIFRAQGPCSPHPYPPLKSVPQRWEGSAAPEKCKQFKGTYADLYDAISYYITFHYQPTPLMRTQKTRSSLGRLKNYHYLCTHKGSSTPFYGKVHSPEMHLTRRKHHPFNHHQTKPNVYEAVN